MIGAKIKELREAKGLSQVKLAAMLGCSRVNVVNWEKDKYMPRTKNYKKLIKIFNLDDL